MRPRTVVTVPLYGERDTLLYCPETPLQSRIDSEYRQQRTL